MATRKPKDPSPDPTTGKEQAPRPLTFAEKVLAALLLIGGAALIWAVLDIFLTDGEWLIEETTTSGEEADKTVTTTKYSDTLPLAALGVGGVLILCGAFYGRLRKVTLPGGAGIELGDAAEKLEKKIEEKAEEKVRQGEVPAEQKDAFVEVALGAGSKELLNHLELAATSPGDDDLDLIADHAVESARERL